MHPWCCAHRLVFQVSPPLYDIGPLIVSFVDNLYHASERRWLEPRKMINDMHPSDVGFPLKQMILSLVLQDSDYLIQ